MASERTIVEEELTDLLPKSGSDRLETRASAKDAAELVRDHPFDYERRELVSLANTIPGMNLSPSMSVHRPTNITLAFPSRALQYPIGEDERISLARGKDTLRIWRRRN
jgi:hypothetical protein